MQVRGRKGNFGDICPCVDDSEPKTISRSALVSEVLENEALIHAGYLMHTDKFVLIRFLAFLLNVLNIAQKFIQENGWNNKNNGCYVISYTDSIDGLEGAK